MNTKTYLLVNSANRYLLDTYDFEWPFVICFVTHTSVNISARTRSPQYFAKYFAIKEVHLRVVPIINKVTNTNYMQMMIHGID